MGSLQWFRMLFKETDQCGDMDAGELGKIRTCANRIYSDMTQHLEKAQK